MKAAFYKGLYAFTVDNKVLGACKVVPMHKCNLCSRNICPKLLDYYTFNCYQLLIVGGDKSVNSYSIAKIYYA